MPSSSLVSGGFRCTEHRAGFVLYLAVGLGNQGSSHRHGSRTGSIRFGNYGICLREIPRTEITPQRPAFRPSLPEEITSFSALTCVQQSVMNLGILMVQGLVNSFGTVVMAAFAAAIK